MILAILYAWINLCCIDPGSFVMIDVVFIVISSIQLSESELDHFVVRRPHCILIKKYKFRKHYTYLFVSLTKLLSRICEKFTKVDRNK